MTHRNRHQGRRRPVFLLGAALLAAGCGGCSSAPDPDVGSVSGDTGDPGEAPPSEAATQAKALREAHFAQFQALLEPAEALLMALDPVAAASIGKGQLGPPPVTRAARADLAEKLEAARKEAADIDAMHLPRPAATGLVGIRFVLDRERDAMTRFLPSRSDPAEIPTRMGALLDEIEIRLVLGLDCSDCARALEAASAALPETSRDLTAFSREGIEGGKQALAQLEAHARRLAADEQLDPSARKLATAAESERAALDARASSLSEATPGSWSDPPPLRGTDILHELPARLGLDALRRRLGVEEGLSVELDRLFESVEGNLERYRVMRDEQGPVTAGRATPLTPARCEAAWSALVEAARARPVLPTPGSLDCDVLVALHPDELDDAALDLLLIDRGFIDADRRAFRATQQPTISLVSGRMGPPAQRTIRRVNYSAALGRPAATALAIGHGEAQLCQAAASLWTHAALGEDAELDAWLARRCASRPAEQWRAEALRDPRGSLEGLSLGTLSGQPMDMVRLDRFWWAPAGQQKRLVDPGREEPGGAPRVPVSMDQIPIDKLVDPDFVPDSVARDRAPADPPPGPEGVAAPPMSPKPDAP